MSGAPQQPSSRTMRLVVVGIALTALLAVVAFVSRGHVAPAGGGSQNRAASQLIANIFFTLFVLAMVAGTLALLYLQGMKRASGRRTTRTKPTAFLVAALLVLTLVLVFGANRFGTANTTTNRGPNLTIPKPKKGQPTPQRAQPVKKFPDPPSFEWELAAAIVALILGVSATAFLRSKRRHKKLVEEVTLAHELAQFLDETLDDIRAEADPRRAVIAAYARMEQILSMHGLPRTESEAPLEYLRRVLGRLEVSERALSKLTSLYERAKFSTHEIDASMKQDAIEALETLRDEVRALAKPPAPQPPPLDLDPVALRIARAYGPVRRAR